MSAAQWISQVWQQKRALNFALLPFAWIFQLITRVRYWVYQCIGPTEFSVPVVVVGNITVGGTGKTPLVIWLANFYREQGYQPGIVLRGYKGNYATCAQTVTPQTAALEVGDEAVLLAHKTQAPVVVGRKRVQAIEHLLAQNPHINIVICDDGLQHYAMARDVEIVVIDGKNKLGNGYCLPAGPLRETPARLARADFVVISNGEAGENQWSMSRRLADHAININTGERLSLADLKGMRAHAVAAIGQPDHFFSMLRDAGIDVIPHAFADHHRFEPQDFAFGTSYPILMTEKDAVKCHSFILPNAWVIPLVIQMPAEFEQTLLRRSFHGQKVTRNPRLSGV